ncbi:PspC domain-containing protein [Paenibacillus marinisediminis]
MNKKLYRSTRDSKLTGLCAGIAEWLNIDATLVRILFVIGVVFSGFTLLIAYFIIALVVPKEPRPPYGPMNYYGNQGYYDPNRYNSNGYSSNGYNPNSYNGHNQDRDSHRNRDYYSKDYNQSNNHTSSIDSMMEDIEKKAMKNEIQQLREKLAKLEKGE